MNEHIFKGCKCYFELFSQCLFIQLLLFGNSLNQKCYKKIINFHISNINAHTFMRLYAYGHLNPPTIELTTPVCETHKCT